MAYISASYQGVNHLNFSNTMFSIYRHYKAKLLWCWTPEEKGVWLVDAVADPTQAAASAKPSQYPNNSKVFFQARESIRIRSMSHPKFRVEHVFIKSVVSRVDRRAEGSNPGAEEVLSVCLVGHSVMDDLRIFLECQGSDLHRNFNLPTVKPTWKVSRGLTFRTLESEFTNYISDYRPNIVILQLAANDVDLICPVTTLTDKYLQLARHHVKYCECRIVIICEALPCSQPRHCCTEDYKARRKMFNSIIKSELLIPGTTGLSVSDFRDSSLWFWSHGKLQGTAQFRDGVHLSNQGQRCLYFSLRMVLREATKQTS